MKKTALLIMVTTIMAISLGSLAEKEITFRNIEWFSTREEVKSALLTDGAKIQGPWDLDSLGAARIVRDGPDDLSVNIYYDYGFADYYEGIKVAGYEVKFIGTHFLFPVKEDQILKNRDLAEFYIGVYSLICPDSSTEQEMHDDLSEKLSYLYGEYSDIDVPLLFGDDTQARLWFDSRDNLITLSFPDSEATIMYCAGDSSSYIDNLLDHSPDSLEGL